MVKRYEKKEGVSVSFEEVILENSPVVEQIVSTPDFITMFLEVIYDPIQLIVFLLSFVVIWFVLNKLKGLGAVIATILIVLFLVLPLIYELFRVFK